MRVLRRVLNAWSEPPFWAQRPPLMFMGSLGEKETIGNDYLGYVRDAYKSNGVVFACILARLLVFSEARFLWRTITDGRPGELFDNAELDLLKEPWPNGTTGELLAHCEQGASLAGNYYGAKIDGRIRNLRPDWVTIVTGSEDDNPYAVDAKPVLYIYSPPRGDPTLLTPAEVIHYSPIPDPAAQWRGMSWLTPVLNEIKSDSAATKHKQRFFENGAIPGLVVSYDASVSTADFDHFVASFKERHEGVHNAYKTMHLGGGADATVVGANLEQLDFKVTQGAGETRIAAAAGVHPVIVGLSEGLAGSSLNAGNFAAARRRFADGTLRPLWRSVSASAQRVLTRPDPTTELWYDDRDIPFLREDAKEEADIDKTQAETIARLTDAGYNPASVVEAVTTGDFTRLVHSGLYSVQLQAPGGSE
jgi:phage portal protein BeeE